VSQNARRVDQIEVPPNAGSQSPLQPNRYTDDSSDTLQRTRPPQEAKPSISYVVDSPHSP